MSYTPTREGVWDFACDSYGKVRHSRKACVFSVVRGAYGERSVKIAAQIENWQDARLIARAPLLLATLRKIAEACDNDQTTLAEIRTLAESAFGSTEWLRPNGGGYDRPLPDAGE